MANTLITNAIIAQQAIREFKNNLVLARTVDRTYSGTFNTKTGNTIKIREPVRLLATPGRVMKLNSINQRYKNLTINRRFHVAIELTDEQLTLQFDRFQEDVIAPAMQTLANRVDLDLYSYVINFYNYVGTAGSPPSTYAVPSKANSVLNALGVPRDNRYLITSEKDGDAMRQGMTGYYDEKFVDPILKEASMGRVANFSVYTAQNVLRSTVASISGSPVVNGVNQVGSSLIISGLAANQVITQGTVFTINGVNLVNRVSYNDVGYQAMFVVLNNQTADGSGNVTLQIAPNIIPIGQYQNVTNSPANNAAITFQPSHTMNVAYHKQAFTLAMINLYQPSANEGVFTKRLKDTNANIAMNMTRWFDGQVMADIVRFDIFYGIQTFEEFGLRVMGS